ncbi:hypothetical protein ANACOL_01563 [Anaerotruncus colihominis DSM 17241]|uniref:Uncharacterized protein n=1 Tax=Anaerotruncus colihominis DSM 17241 TaxID=445972 RepID=B0P9Z4_9FIRM|nr:hypothetical protein ANACOL_01563 [Anaerotruncus colihominis DSM 17241]
MLHKQKIVYAIFYSYMNSLKFNAIAYSRLCNKISTVILYIFRNKKATRKNSIYTF